MTNDIENVTNDAVNSTGSTANNTIAPVTPETPSALPPVVELQDISFIEKVGSGSYGVVYKAEWTRDSVQITVAVKEFSVGGEQKAFETEIKQLSRVQHPNIIALFGISGDSNTKYIIMEHAEGGSLHTFLHGNVKPYYSTAHAMSWARQCAEGVAYLHKMTPKPLIHRDLKPLNLLLTNKARLLKICDFGTVADKQTLMTNNKGSAAWMAPEVFEGSRYTEKCDIFSWAIVLWEVLSRQQPFREIDNTYQIMWKIHKGERPPLIKDCPKPIEKLMTSCWATLPDKRPSMQCVVAEMNELVSLFPGADEPIEYEFVNQQIILPDDSSNSAAVDGDNYTLDFSSFTSSYNNSTQRTPTNSSDFLTPTNSGGSILFNPHGEVPVIIWDAIPEQPDEELDHTPTGDNSGNIFNLTPSAETSQRNETIRNGMTQMGSIPMAPLPPLDIDPNAWDLNNGTDDSQASAPANGDIRDRLMVTTDARPILQHNTAPTGTTAGNDNSSRLNANCYDDNDNGYADADENDCETDQSLVDMLDPELQPEAPIANNAESLAIYREHQRLAKEYLRIDTKIYFALDFKEKLLINMDPAEREQKTTLLKKLKEKEELQSICNFLKSQVNANAAPPASDNRNSGSSVNELVSDDGWVVIPTNQNT